MLSRLYARTVFRQNQCQPFNLTSYRSSGSTAVTQYKKVYESIYIPSKSRLDEALVPQPVPFYGPERDLKNFPDPVRQEYISPVRLAFIPEEWFLFIQKKLGVSGPYTLGIGIMNFLICKEFYLLDHDHNHTMAFFCWVYILSKSGLGTKAVEFERKLWDEEAEEWREFKKKNENARVVAIEHEKKEQWRQEGHQIIYEAKKENVALQKEAAYRENIMNLYKQVKNRLDYQVEISKIDARIKQQYMVEWTIKKVQEAITPEQEKDALKKCIVDLEALAAKA